MALHRLALLALAALGANLVMAKDTPAEPAQEDPDMPPKLAVKIRTSFPQSEIFGVKLVNGKATQALISVENDEPKDVTVAFVGGSLWGPDPKTNGETSVIVRNLTSTRYNVKIPSGEKESLNFHFATEMHPQELRLSLMAILTADGGSFYTFNAFNETVSIVEPDASFFDPQLIFLYFLLLGMFAGSSYWIYTTWIATLFPQKGKPTKTGERSKKGGKQVTVVDGDGSAVTTSVNPNAYDESWIPQHHLQRPEAKRVKSGGGGGGKSKKAGKVE